MDAMDGCCCVGSSVLPADVLERRLPRRFTTRPGEEEIECLGVSSCISHHGGAKIFFFCDHLSVVQVHHRRAPISIVSAEGVIGGNPSNPLTGCMCCRLTISQ